AAHRLALLLNQDGELPDDAERARRRYLIIAKQGVDGMSRFHGLLDPEARATLDAVFANWPHRACATRRTRNPVWTANPVTTPCRPTPGRRGSATTTRSKPWADRCWPRGSWAATTGCRPPSLWSDFCTTGTTVAYGGVVPRPCSRCTLTSCCSRGLRTR